MKIYIQIVFIVSLIFILFDYSNLLGAELRDDIQIELNYSPSPKTINLSIVNTGEDAVFLYNPDLKPRKYHYAPALLEVKLKNEKNEILSNVRGANDGFISSAIFESKLSALPMSPFILKPNESINLKVNFYKLVSGYKSYILNLEEVKRIKLRFSVLLDGNLNHKKTYTTGWLLFNN